MARGAWWPAVGSRDQTYISSAAPRLVYLSYSVVVMALVGASQGGGESLCLCQHANHVSKIYNLHLFENYTYTQNCSGVSM